MFLKIFTIPDFQILDCKLLEAKDSDFLSWTSHIPVVGGLFLAMKQMIN